MCTAGSYSALPDDSATRAKVAKDPPTCIDNVSAGCRFQVAAMWLVPSRIELAPWYHTGPLLHENGLESEPSMRI
jgi:hypothetical protein